MERIFISYSHLDEKWKNRVVKHLNVLAEEGLIVWDDRKISAGAEWLKEIEEAMDHCEVALLLISPDFLTSDFITRNEIPKLLERRENEGVRVIPVIVSACQWTKKLTLKDIQGRPKDGKPLAEMTKPKAESALSALAGEIHDLLQAATTPPTPAATGPETGKTPPQAKTDLTHLPVAAPHFLGRTTELAELDAAWADAGKTAVFQLIAPGGTGKTALMNRWLDQMRAEGWRGAAKVFGWSFYSQGSGDDRQASDDGFLAAALAFFQVSIAASVGAWDKGVALAAALQRSRALLVLDGLEPLQYPPTDQALPGELKASGLKALLTTLARSGQPGLVLLTSREALKDVAGWLHQAEDNPGGTVRLRDLGNLSDSDGARLLHKLGVEWAGAAKIGPDDAELLAVSQTLQGHALTLSLVGTYLKSAKGGDVRRWPELDFARANDKSLKGHAFHAVATYETWFQREGAAGARELVALRLLGYFDRPASRANLAALTAAPAIDGLTEALVGLDADDWHITLSHLQDAGLAQFDAQSGSLDAHPLIREYLAHALRSHQPDAWREGHKRIYEQLKRDTPHRPEGLAGLQPLYQAVAHGCLAGLQQEACDEIYWNRISREGEAYAVKKLGAFAADLGAVACFFDSPWNQPAAALSEAAQAWLLNEAAFSLRALGRLDEALQPMRVSGEMDVKRSEWIGAATSFNNLSELQLSLGRLAAAVSDGRAALDHAERSGDAFYRMTTRTALADALHQHGQPASAEFQEAEKVFQAAEALQAEHQPQYPLLYSVRGFQYCDLLLAEAERAAWCGGEFICPCASSSSVGLAPGPAAWCRGELVRPGTEDASRANKFAPTAVLQSCAAVKARAAQALAWAEIHLGPLDIALDHLTLARCALYAGLIQGQPPDPVAQAHAEQALAGLRAAGSQHHIPRGLLTRAWLRASLNDPAGAQADLDEAQRIAERGNMKLHQADIALHRARLFADRDALTKARTLIKECEYFRRLPELEEAEAAARHWPLPAPQVSIS
ncbi:MAG: hypothetical protein RIR00_471 [Pseudomonadota bacterium]|jgi:hypothetical protein